MFLYKSLLTSDGLFFIQYAPRDIFKSCWYLVKINNDETKIWNMEARTTDDYHVTFLSRHPSNNHLCDDNERWWPLRYAYVMVKKNMHVY